MVIFRYADTFIPFFLALFSIAECKVVYGTARDVEYDVISQFCFDSAENSYGRFSGLLRTYEKDYSNTQGLFMVTTSSPDYEGINVDRICETIRAGEGKFYSFSEAESHIVPEAYIGQYRSDYNHQVVNLVAVSCQRGEEAEVLDGQQLNFDYMFKFVNGERGIYAQTSCEEVGLVHMYVFFGALSLVTLYKFRDHYQQLSALGLDQAILISFTFAVWGNALSNFAGILYYVSYAFNGDYSVILRFIMYYCELATEMATTYVAVMYILRTVTKDSFTSNYLKPLMGWTGTVYNIFYAYLVFWQTEDFIMIKYDGFLGILLMITRLMISAFCIRALYAHTSSHNAFSEAGLKNRFLPVSAVFLSWIVILPIIVAWGDSLAFYNENKVQILGNAFLNLMIVYLLRFILNPKRASFYLPEQEARGSIAEDFSVTGGHTYLNI